MVIPVPAPNTIARPYRGLSVQRIAPPATTAALLDHVRSRPVYRRTAYMALRWTGGTALLAIRPGSGDGLFCPVAEVRLLAGPDDVVWIDEPHVDVGNASALAAAAARHRTPTALAYLVRGRYSHVNLIWRPHPVAVVVDEVVPPHPAKLVEMVRQAVAVDEDLPPVRVVARLVSLPARLKAGGPGHYLLPCRGAGSGTAERSRRIDYLDDGPAERGDWTLLGCERSAQIHEHHYGDRPGLLDFCPADLALDDRPRITKCCLLQRGIEVRGRTAVVPWGATHREVAAALTEVLDTRAATAEVAEHVAAGRPSVSAGAGSAATHLRDSAQYGHLWMTEPMRVWFGEDHRLRCWLGIYASLAAAQADLGLVPRAAADRIAEIARTGEIDLAELAAATVRTGHSTAGLVTWLQAEVGAETAPYVGLGATVQDVSDTWTALTLRRTGELAAQDLIALLQMLRRLTERYRATPMAARTHGQVGVPITVGFKTAGWAAECERHLDRFAEGRERWEVAPLGGSVGSIAYWGTKGPDLLDAFAARTGLGAPVLPWGCARDAVAEFACWAELTATLLGRIGNEVYQLQRTEIGELTEAVAPGQISSVTMPHKRNPELAEHLVTLRRLVSASARLLVDGALVEHERDGRMWKAEWVALPDLCCALTRATRACVDLVRGLQVQEYQMTRNLAAAATSSEQVVTALAGRLGRDQAFAAVRTAIDRAGPGGAWLAELACDPRIADTDLTFTADVADHGAIASAAAFADRWLRAGTQW